MRWSTRLGSLDCPEPPATCAMLLQGDAGDPAVLTAWRSSTISWRRFAYQMIVAAMGGIDPLVFTGGIGEHQQRSASRTVCVIWVPRVELDSVGERCRSGDAGD